MDYYKVDESVSCPNYWMIFPTLDLYKAVNSLKGSFLVYPAKTLGLLYGDYCMYCKQNFNASLFPNGEYIKTAYKNKADAIALSDLLNRRFKEILSETSENIVFD